MKKIVFILTLVFLSACANSGNPELDEKLYSIDSRLTFSVPTSEYTMTSGGGMGTNTVEITYGNSDLAMMITIKTDLSQMQGMYDWNLEPLSVSKLLSGYSGISKSCEARFVEKGGECIMNSNDIVEVVHLKNQVDKSIDEYLVVQYPYGKGDGVAGLLHIFASINLDPTDQELAAATSISF